MKKEELKNIFNKKLLIKIYCIFFILLNVIDFLNIIGGDLDFFKKILSWVLIAYVFYNISLTKLFIGKRMKKYDIIFILIFCLIVIPKSLFLYTSGITDIELSGISENEINNYHIFSPILKYIKHFQIEEFLQIITYTNLLGIILIIIFSIILYSNNPHQNKSFLGSLELKETYFKPILEILSLIFINLFFAIIVFNLFMEWFALAVDALILVLGLIYYLFEFIKHHTSGKISSALSTISNTGNDFYQNLISMFSNKKTIFIACSVLLAVHLLVDIGVYLIPYIIGTQNTLYFSSLDIGGRLHSPIFSFFSSTFQSSLFYQDIFQNLSFENILYIISVMMIYIVNILLFFIMMFLPFYYLYRNMLKKKVILPKVISIFILVGIFFYLTISLIGTISNTGDENIYDIKPIKISTPMKDSSVKGVDIYTEPVLKHTDDGENNSYIIVGSFLILLIIFMFIMFRYEKYKFFYEKLILVTILFFFIFYVMTFFISTVEVETKNLRSEIQGDLILNYENINSFYENDSFYKNNRYKKSGIILFSDVINIQDFNVKNNVYILWNINFLGENIENNHLNFDKNRVTFNRNNYDFNKKIFENNTTIITKLNNENYQIKGNNIILSEPDLQKILGIYEESAKNIMYKPIKFLIDLIRIIFLSLFYLFGTVYYITYFFKKNLKNN